jgi:HSP20 family protein
MAAPTPLQSVPVNVYRTADTVTVAAPMPGLEAENIAVDVRADGHLVVRGRLRGALKDVKEVLVEEWSAGPYHREVDLPAPVDGEGAIVTYGNGVLVVALPVAARTRPAQLALEQTGPSRGQRVPDGTTR